jgi:hypothetical protein
VMLDSDLAGLYGVKTKVLNQAIKRNRKRFPEDFMFKLSKNEFDKLAMYLKCGNLRSQFVTSSWGGSRYENYVFTEHGVAMISSILNSRKAIEINILIIRAFIKMRELLATHKNLAMKIAQLEIKYDDQFVAVFNALKHLMKEPDKKKAQIGFKV